MTGLSTLFGNWIFITHFCFLARSENGFCLAGFSATIRKSMNTVVMGAVMGKDQLGIQLWSSKYKLVVMLDLELKFKLMFFFPTILPGTVFQQRNADSVKYNIASADQTGAGLYLGLYESIVT